MNGANGTFRRAQNVRTAPKRAQIHPARTKTGEGAGRAKARRAPVRNEYAMNGNESTAKGLYPIAASGLPLRSRCKARRVPQPGQKQPVRPKNGQIGYVPGLRGSTLYSIAAPVMPAAASSKHFARAERDTPTWGSSGPTVPRVASDPALAIASLHPPTSADASPNITSTYASANKDGRKNSNRMPKPSPKDTHVQVFALFEVLRAPSRSPAWSFPLTWAAKTIATMPVGRQQKTVTRMAWTR